MKRIANGLSIIVPVFVVFSMSADLRAADKPFELNDGDRIALVGNDFFERDLDQAYIETQLTTRFPEKNLTFRNLGYAGDTVFGDARSLCAGWQNFGPADQGFNRLKKLIAHLKPTVVFVAYGMNESFEGAKGLADFQRGLGLMLDMLAEATPRIVLISPTRHEDLGRPMPDPSEHNHQLGLYIAAISSEAAHRGYGFIDLYSSLGDGTRSNPAQAFTRDGIHLTPYGYWRAAAAIEQGLGYAPRTWHVQIDSDGKLAAADGSQVDHVRSAEGVISFDSRDAMLPVASAPSDAPAEVISGKTSLPGTARLLAVAGLKPGRYVLKCGDQVVAAAPAEAWGSGVDIRQGPACEQTERLRQLIRLKNQDFFNYWRPENDTYIFGYRQREQGRNAVEIPRFEPLAVAKDAQIAEMRVPHPLTYSLSAEN